MNNCGFLYARLSGHWLLFPMGQWPIWNVKIQILGHLKFNNSQKVYKNICTTFWNESKEVEINEITTYLKRTDIKKIYL